MFSGEIYYYLPLNSVEKIGTNAVAVMYIRNIPMAEKRIVCFQSKKVISLKPLRPFWS